MGLQGAVALTHRRPPGGPKGAHEACYPPRSPLGFQPAAATTSCPCLSVPAGSTVIKLCDVIHTTAHPHTPGHSGRQGRAGLAGLMQHMPGEGLLDRRTEVPAPGKRNAEHTHNWRGTEQNSVLS